MSEAMCESMREEVKRMIREELLQRYCPNQPMQPVYYDKHDVIRFKENTIVRFLLEHSGITLNDIAMRQFPQADQEQFAQLIGYSVSGFCDLSYVSEWTQQLADDMVEELSELVNPPSSEPGEQKTPPPAK